MKCSQIDTSHENINFICNWNESFQNVICCNSHLGLHYLQSYPFKVTNVPHRRLLHKLDYYGIRWSTHKWINWWLSGPTQQVVLDGQASDPVPVLSGVPQGSVLGQILFFIFINDLPDNIRSYVRLFADDCVLYRNIH